MWNSLTIIGDNWGINLQKFEITLVWITTTNGVYIYISNRFNELVIEASKKSHHMSWL